MALQNMKRRKFMWQMSPWINQIRINTVYETLVRWTLLGISSLNGYLIPYSRTFIILLIIDNGWEYEFRLACCNDIGCGQEAISVIRTPEKSPTGPPTNISFHHITGSSIAVSWEDPVPSLCNGRILGYNFQLHKFETLVSERNVSSPKVAFHSGKSFTGAEKEKKILFFPRLSWRDWKKTFLITFGFPHTPGKVLVPSLRRYILQPLLQSSVLLVTLRPWLLQMIP